MSSYQQISASQNPYPSLPYSQNFPNEPDTESSQLQAPLNNQPQHYYPPPPQHLGYGHGQQQPVPMNHPGQFYGVAQGPNQQPQYMMVPVDPERRGLGLKISDIDSRLDSGWYFCYKILLWLNIIGSILGLFRLSICLIAVFLPPDNFKGPTVIFITVASVVLLLFIGLYVWILHYSVVFKNAMSDKSLEGARRGFKSMIGNSICSFVLMICAIAVIESMINVSSHYSKKENWVPYYVQAMVYLYALPTFFRLFGAKKVIDLLAERETFVHELNTRFGTNLA